VWLFTSPSRTEPGPSGGGLILRPPEMGHFEQWRQLRHESRAFLEPWEPVWPHDDLTRQGFRRRLRHYRVDAERGTALTWFIFRENDNCLLGGLAVASIRRGAAQSAQLGYWMGERFAGQGYMKLAVHLTLAFLFNEMELERVEAACVPRNSKSASLLKSSGFRKEGYLRGYLEINGVREDHQLYAILKSDFHANRIVAKNKKSRSTVTRRRRTALDSSGHSVSNDVSPSKD
jgi:[ribosomal protein S5]-alanine N-acetyltransferase